MTTASSKLKPAKFLSLVLLGLGFALQTYIATVESSHFSVGFWLWGLSPYLIGAALLFLFRQTHATVGALVGPILLDSGNFYSVFISPQSSTAALGLLFVPLWNILVLVPVGGFFGWYFGKRLQDAELAKKSVETRH